MHLINAKNYFQTGFGLELNFFVNFATENALLSRMQQWLSKNNLYSW
jgi:hypothetical protein